MTARPLSPFESGYFAADARLGSVPVGGMPLFIGTAVRGKVDEHILRRVLGELAAGHVLLRSRVDTVGGVARFVAGEPVMPTLTVREGGVDEYWELVNSPQDWAAGLFRAVLLRGVRESRIVLVIHHGISDGRSAFALLEEMWRRYAAHAAGTEPPLHDSDDALLGGVDELLAAVVGEAEVDGFLAHLAQEIAEASPADAPHTMPHDGDGVGDAGGRLALRRIELSPGQTAELVEVARGRGISVNSVLAGAALAAVRGELAGDGPIPLMCGHAADLRPDLSPPVPVSTILNCASGAGTPALVDRDADPLAVGAVVDTTMRVLRESRFPALFMRAAQRPLAPQVAAMLSQPPAIALSNMGRLPAHPMPDGLEFVRDEVFAMAAGMPPKMTIFTVGGRLTVQVEYDTAEHSHTRMGRVAEAMSDRLARVTRVAVRG
ncbi:phthiocerol/phthiodiolone dimycocerosyl transferase family protein [Nocardia sp. NPDC004340]